MTGPSPMKVLRFSSFLSLPSFLVFTESVSTPPALQ